MKQLSSTEISQTKIEKNKINMSKMNIPLYKMLLIGDSGVGKTCTLCSFSGEGYRDSSFSTIGIDFKIRLIEVNGKKIKLQIWDTAGQERFKTITTSYYRGARGIILAYDTTNEKSFDNVKQWMRLINEHASEDVEKLLIGTKCDLINKREVTKERGEQLAEKYDIKFFETSAKMNINIEEAFYSLAQDIYDKTQEKPITMENPKNDFASLTSSRPGQQFQKWFNTGCSIL